MAVPAELRVMEGLFQELRSRADMGIGGVVDPGLFLAESLVLRQPVDRAKQLEAHAACAKALNVVHERLGQVRPVDHVQEGAPDVHVRNHARGMDLLARPQAHPVGTPVTHEDLLDPRLAPDLHAMRFTRGGKGVGDRPHAALAEAHAGLADQVGDEVERRARTVGADISTDRRPEHELGLDQVILEPLPHIVVRAHGKRVKEVVHLLLGVPVAPGEAERPHDARRILAEGVHGRLELQPAQDFDGRLKPGEEFRVVLRVALRKPRDLLAGLHRVLRKDDSVVLGRVENVRLRVVLQSELPQLQFLDHLGMQMAKDECIGRGAVSGRELFRDARPANVGFLFQDERPLARTRQIGAASQAVMTAAHHDGVVFSVRAHARHRQSFRISLAALWPGNAETDPPGWVEAPVW